MNNEKQHTPNAPNFTVSLKSGRQVKIEDVTIGKLIDLCYRQLDRMSRAAFLFLMYHAELEKRDDVDFPDVLTQNIFDIMQTSAMLGMNTFNGVQRDLYGEEE
tara:strand:- start:202 stop:510 length:309 start_codon:yes stop_codon:yes gene_type:complete